MKRILLPLPLAVLLVAGSPTTSALAQDAKIARGTVIDIGGASVTVKVRDADMKFGVDSRTRVNAPGAATRARQASTGGKSGQHLGDLLRVGQAVAVTYLEGDGSLRATSIRAISSAGDGGGSIVDPSEEMTSNGMVQWVAPGFLTITGSSGGGASFTQTFVIDAKTTVIGKGAGTAVAARGGKAPITELIASGDKVSVSYHKVGGALHASDVRITAKATH